MAADVKEFCRHGRNELGSLGHRSGGVALLFGGRGKLSSIMGDAAKGIRAFKDGLKGEDEVATEATAAKPLPREKDEARS